MKGLNDDLQLRREMEEKKRKHDLQCQLRNTHPRFATQPEYQTHPMNLLVSTDQNQYQQPDDEGQQVGSQEPCLSSPTITFMKTNTPTSEKGYDCGEIEHYENNYLEKFVENKQEPEYNVHRKQVHGNKLKRNYILGRLNSVDMITTHGAKEVIYGLIAVSYATAMVRFDPSASHSFISSAYVKDHKITMLPMRKPMIVRSLGGEMKANRICPRVSLHIKGENLKQTLLY